MQKLIYFIFVTSFISVNIFAQDPRAKGKSKLEYYNNVLVPERGLKPLKKSTGSDRKLSVMNVGNVFARISNAATLGYDRWGLCWEFPARSQLTYRWTMAPMIGAVKNGKVSVAISTRGAARKHEEELDPIKGYDSGVLNEEENIGIAFSDIKASWPKKWPSFTDLPSYAKKVNYPLPKVDSIGGFPGIRNGEVVSTREAFFAVTDNSPVSGEGNIPNPLDVRVDVWGLQYDDILNRNFIVFRQLFTNVGTDTLKDVYVGIHDDPDCPEQGAAEWTDDYAAFIKSGTTGIPGYTSKEDTLLWNFTYLWDGDDKAEGFIPKNVAWLGLKFLETPINPATGRQSGITTFQVFEYSAVPQGDDEEYKQMKAGIMAPQNVAPHAKDYTQTPNSYGPDVTYVVAAGPYTLAPGQSLPFSFASVHGVNKKDLFMNAILCQLLYNAQFNAAEAPPEPKVKAVGMDKKVVLYWDDSPTKGIYRKADGTIDHTNDRLTKNNAFEGYKIFRSTDRGITWGNPIYDYQGVQRGIIPLAQYDLKNGITGESQHSLGRYFNLGEDTGLKHMFVDNNVSNGSEYWYAVSAYDHDDGPIPPLQNSIKADPYKDGDNTVAAIPQAAPIGKIMGNADNGAVHKTGIATLPKIPVTTLYPAFVQNDSFKISFNVKSNTDKKYSLTNLATSKYVVSIHGDTVKNFSFYNSEKDNNPIFNGMTIYVNDTTQGVAKSSQVFPANTTRLVLDAVVIINPDSLACEQDYRIEFTNDSSWVGNSGNVKQIYKAPFKVFNANTNKRILALIEEPASGGTSLKYDHTIDKIVITGLNYKAGDWGADQTVTIDTTASFFSRGAKSTTNDKSIFVSFASTSSFQSNDVYSIEMKKTLKSEDTYVITSLQTSEKTMVKDDLRGIMVVPNPYIVTSAYEQEKYGFQKKLQFQKLPDNCTIRIYNIAGDLVRTLNHTSGSIETWNIQNENEQEVSFGVYIFHVDSPGIGNYIGKFALIK